MKTRAELEEINARLSKEAEEFVRRFDDRPAAEQMYSAVLIVSAVLIRLNLEHGKELIESVAIMGNQAIETAEACIKEAKKIVAERKQ